MNSAGKRGCRCLVAQSVFSYWVSGQSVRNLDLSQPLDRWNFSRIRYVEIEACSFRVALRFIQLLQDGCGESGFSSLCDRTVAKNERHSEASSAGAEIDDIPLFQFQTKVPPVLWRVGFPFLFGEAEIRREVRDESVPQWRRWAESI